MRRLDKIKGNHYQISVWDILYLYVHCTARGVLHSYDQPLVMQSPNDYGNTMCYINNS